MISGGFLIGPIDVSEQESQLTFESSAIVRNVESASSLAFLRNLASTIYNEIKATTWITGTEEANLSKLWKRRKDR